MSDAGVVKQKKENNKTGAVRLTWYTGNTTKIQRHSSVTRPLRRNAPTNPCSPCERPTAVLRYATFR